MPNILKHSTIPVRGAMSIDEIAERVTVYCNKQFIEPEKIVSIVHGTTQAIVYYNQEVTAEEYSRVFG